MNETILALIAKYGLDYTIKLIERLSTVTTWDDALAALKELKTAKQYVDESAARLNISAKPLPPIEG